MENIIFELESKTEQGNKLKIDAIENDRKEIYILLGNDYNSSVICLDYEQVSMLTTTLSNWLFEVGN